MIRELVAGQGYDQTDVIKASERGETVAIDGAVERIDTHLNHVVLAANAVAAC